MTYGENGSVIGPQNLPTTSAAPGVWSMGEVAEAQRDGIWPNPTDGFMLWMGNFDGDTTTQGDLYFRQLTPMDSSDAKFYMNGQINNGYLPAPTSFTYQAVINDTDLTPISSSQKQLKTTSPAANTSTNSSQYNQDYVDSSDNFFGCFNQGSVASAYSFANSVFYQTDSSYNLVWRVAMTKNNQNTGQTSWYPYRSGNYMLAQCSAPTGQPAHYGKLIALFRANVSSSSSWPQDFYYVTNTRAASYDPWSGLDAYRGLDDGNDAYSYGMWSGYAAGVQGPLISKWAGPGSALSYSWNRFITASGGGTPISQISAYTSTGPVTCGYRSSGNPYPTFMVQLDTSGNISWQREWVHATSGNYMWPVSLLADSSDNLYWFGYYTDSTDTGGSQNRPTIMKVDSSGNKVWIASATVTVSGSTVAYQPADMIFSSDGGLIFVGYGNDGGYKQNIFVKLGDTDSPAGESGSITTGAGSGSTFDWTWVDTTSDFAESTPTHTSGAWSYWSSSTSMTGWAWIDQGTTGTPTYTAWTSDDVSTGAF